MSNPDLNKLDDLEIDVTNLYREETITDLRVATIQQLTPIKPDGSIDESRASMFIAQTQIMSQMGPVPVQGPIEASTLEEALTKVPEAIKLAVDNLIAEAEKRQRDAASRIVVPGAGAGGLKGGGGVPGDIQLM